MRAPSGSDLADVSALSRAMLAATDMIDACEA